MPLVKDKIVIPRPVENDLTPITPRLGQRESGEYKNSVVDLRKRSVDTLLANIEGSKWQVVYYRQLLTKEMMPVSHQPTQTIPYQQYEKISEYPLIVTSPLSSSQNSENALFTVTGVAFLTLAIIPNVGDMFIADIGDGRDGLFSVESFTRMTILKDSVFQIEYTLISYDNKKIINDLEKKVVRNLYYSEDHIGSGRGPLLTDIDLYAYRKIKEELTKLIDYHTYKFLDKNNTTLLRPDCGGIYDPYFSIFWDKIIPKDTMSLADIPRIIIVGDEYKKYITIWDCLINKHIDKRKLAMGIKISSAYKNFVNLIYNGIALTDIKHVVTIDENFLIPEPLPQDSNDERIDVLVNFHSISNSGYYVLSESFYLNKQSQMSKLEYLILNYLNSKTLNLEHYNELLKNVKRLGDLEQFYYIPILIILGIDYLRNIS